MIQLPELYSKHLKKQFSYSQYLILVILINLLQDLHTVRLEEIAHRFPLPIQLRSRVKFFQDVVQELIRFSTAKHDYYRKGMRAKTLIQQAF